MLIYNFDLLSAQCLSLFGCEKEGGYPRRKMTKCDMGEGFKNIDILSDILYEWPLVSFKTIFFTNYSTGFYVVTKVAGRE